MEQLVVGESIAVHGVCLTVHTVVVGGFECDASAETMKQLQQMGFEVVQRPQSGKLLVGRIAVEKLTALAQLSAIKYVAPHRL